jgi:hypothetical protein
VQAKKATLPGGGARFNELLPLGCPIYWLSMGATNVNRRDTNLLDGMTINSRDLCCRTDERKNLRLKTSHPGRTDRPASQMNERPSRATRSDITSPNPRGRLPPLR